MVLGALALVWAAAAPLPQSDAVRTTPTVTIAAFESPVTEGRNATFRVTASSAPSSNVQLNVSLTESGASIVGTRPTEITLRTGSTTAWLIVQTDFDGTDDTDGSVTGTLDSGTGYSVGSPSSATVTVYDTPTVTMWPYTTPVMEGSTASFQVTADRAPLLDLQVSIDVTEAGSYITGTVPTEVTLSAGSRWAWVSIETEADSTDESDGSVTVSLQSGTWYEVGSPSTTTTMVLDGPTVTIALDSTPVTEGSDAWFLVTADRAPLSAVQLNIDVTDNGSYLTGTDPTEVTLSAGTRWAWVYIFTDDDDTIEPDGSVTVSLLSGAGYNVGRPSSATVVVIDDDQLEVTIAPYTTPVTEGTSARFRVTADEAPSLDIQLNIDVTESGSFITGTVPTEVTLSADSTTAWVIIRTDDDSTNELDGSVTVALDSGTGYDVGSPSSATVRVYDEPTVTIAAPTPEVREGAIAWFRVMSDRAPLSDVQLNIDVTEVGSYIMGTPPTEVTLPAGSTTAWVSIRTDDDSTDEPDGSVTVRLQSGTGYQLESPLSATVTVIDEPTVTIEPSTTPVTEGAAAWFRVTSDRAPASDVQLNIDVTEVGSYIMGTPPTEVTLPAGSTTAWVTIPTHDDSTEESDGSVTVRILTGTPYNVGSPSSATVEIEDNDPDEVTPEVTIAAHTTPVTEGTNATFRVTADEAPSSDIQLNIDVTESGSFITGTRPTEVTLSAGLTTAWVIVQTEDDSTDESDGSVTASLQSGTGYDVGSPSSATVRVTDNDPTVTIAAFESPVTEGRNATFRVTASSAPSSDVQLNVSLTESGASITGMRPTQIMLSQGSTTAWLIVQTADDGTDETDGSVTGSILSGTGYQVGSPSSATVLVYDTPTVTIEPGTTPVTEGSTAWFEVTADRAPLLDVQVNIDVTEVGSYITGTRPPEVTLSAGSTTAMVGIETDDDSTEEPDGSVMVSLQPGTWYEVGSSLPATVVVEDNDSVEVTPEVTIAAYTTPVTEGTSARFRVTADEAPSSNIQLNIDVTESGSFITGIRPTAVTLYKGSTMAWVIVQTDDDSTDELDGSVTASLQSGTGYDVGSPSSATVMVKDKPTLTISPSTTPVTEGTSAGFVVTSDRALGANLDVRVAVTEVGSYITGTVPTEVTLSTGSTTAWVIIETDDDSTDELDGSVTVTLQSDMAYQLKSPLSATVMVYDKPTLTISAGTTPVTEGTSAGFEVMSDRAPGLRLDVRVTVTEVGSYITGTVPTEVTLPAMSTTALVIIETDDDSAYETDGSVTVALQSGTGYNVGTDSSDTVEVENNDPMPTPGPDSMPVLGDPVLGQTYVVGAPVDVTLPEATGGDAPLTYSLTPALPAGLTFDAATRTIAGTPTTATAAAEYTYTVTDGDATDADTAMLAFDITVIVNECVFLDLGTVVPGGSPSAASANGSWSSACESLSRPGKYARFYRLELQSEAAELQIDLESSEDAYVYLLAGSGTVGSPVTAGDVGSIVAEDDQGGSGNNARIVTTDLAAGTYTIEATTYLSGQTGSFTLELTTTAPPDSMPVLGDPVLDQTYAVDEPVSVTLPAATGGDAPLTYSLTPALPAGLTFDAATRTIAGTPTTATAAAEYTYTVTDGDATDADTAMLAFDITVIVNECVFLDLGTVVPGGSPSAASASGSWSSACESLSRPGKYARFYRLELQSEAAELQIDLESSEDAYVYLLAGSGTVGSPVTAGDVGSIVAEDDQGGSGNNARIVTTDLAAGTYTIEATTYLSGQTGSFTLELTATAPPDSMPVLGEPVLDQTYAVDGPVSVTLPAATGGDAPLTYSLTPALPAGLTFDAATRTIAGTPTTATAAAEYTYTVTDGDATDADTAMLAFDITVIVNECVFLDLGIVVPGGSPSTASASGSWSSVCESLSRPGKYARFYRLELQSEAGEVQIDLESSEDAYVYLLAGSGTVGSPVTAGDVGSIVAEDDQGGSGNNARIVTTDLAAGTYTIEATTYLSARTGSFTLELGTTGPDPKPVFGEPVPDQAYAVGAPVDVTLPEATGGDAPLTYSLTPALPTGLTFDAATRTIAGTPTTVAAAVEYTYTVTDGDATDPDTATLTFDITVIVDECVFLDLGTVVPGGSPSSASGSSSNACASLSRSGTYYAQFYRFELQSEAAELQIDLESSEDAYVYLLAGSGTVGSPVTAGDVGSIVADDDDGGSGGNARIVAADLAAGTYTIEATTYYSGRTGSFTLELGTTGLVDLMPTGLATSADNASGTITLSWDADANLGYEILQWVDSGFTPLPFDSLTVTCGGAIRSICPAGSTSAVVSGYTTGAYEYTIRGHNGVQSSGTIADTPPSTSIVVGDAAPTFQGATIQDQTLEVNGAASLQLPIAVGGAGALSYTVTPTLPAGLTFDAATRMVSGTPTTASPSTSHTYTVTDSDTTDPDTATLAFTITVDEAIAIADLPSALYEGESGSITVSAAGLSSSTTYQIQLLATTTDPDLSNSLDNDIGFDALCSDAETTKTLPVPPGSTSHSVSVTVYACSSSHGGGTVSATLREGTIDHASNAQFVGVRPISVRIEVDDPFPGSGDTATFAAIVDGPDGATFAYQWQEETAGLWSNIDLATLSEYGVAKANPVTMTTRVVVQRNDEGWTSEPVSVTWNQPQLVQEILDALTTDLLSPSGAFTGAQAALEACLTGSGRNIVTTHDYFPAFITQHNEATPAITTELERCEKKSEIWAALQNSFTATLRRIQNTGPNAAYIQQMLQTTSGQQFVAEMANPKTIKGIMVDFMALASDVLATGREDDEGNTSRAHLGPAGMDCMPGMDDDNRHNSAMLDTKFRALNCLIFNTHHVFWVILGNTDNAEERRNYLAALGWVKWLDTDDFKCSIPEWVRVGLGPDSLGERAACLKHDVAWESLRWFEGSTSGLEIDAAWNPRNKYLADTVFLIDNICQDRLGEDRQACLLENGDYWKAIGKFIWVSEAGKRWFGVARINGYDLPITEEDRAHAGGSRAYVACDPPVPSVSIRVVRNGNSIEITSTLVNNCLDVAIDSVTLCYSFVREGDSSVACRKMEEDGSLLIEFRVLTVPPAIRIVAAEIKPSHRIYGRSVYEQVIGREFTLGS